MRVPILDPVKGNESIQKELEETALRVLRSGQFIMGDDVLQLEDRCAKFCGAKHAIAVSSGTDALLLALMAYDIGPGDEVICPAFTFFATAGSIARVGATPVFVDIQYDTFNIDPDCVEKAITENTKAIIPVHLFGQCADMSEINQIAKRHGLAVIEDACQAIGAFYYPSNRIRKSAGNLGDIGCFSFFPSKNVGGFGDGGLVTTNNDELAEKMRALRVHGGTRQYYHDMIGANFRMDALQAALLDVKLRNYDRGRKRKENAQLYIHGSLGSPLYVLPKVKENAVHVWNQYTIRVLDDKRDTAREYLGRHGIATGVYYPLPLHKQPCFQKFVGELSLPIAEQTCNECLSLPIASELTDLQIDYVVTRLKLFEKGDR